MASTIDPKTGLPITNQAIPTSALSTPQTPLTITPPADTTPILTSAMNTGGSYTQQAQESTLLDQQAAQAQQDRVAGAGTVADLTRMAGGRLQERANLAQTNGENDLLKQISGYNTQAQGLIREATAIPLQTGAAYQGSSGIQAGVASVNRDLLQRNALQSLTLAQSTAIAQGNYDVAKNLADQQVNAKYAQIDAEIAAKKINEEAMYKNITDPAIKRADSAKNELLKRQLEERMAQTKREEEAKDEKKAQELELKNLSLSIGKNGAPASVVSKIANAKSFNDAVIAAAPYMQSLTDKADLSYKLAQTAKIYNDIKNDNAVSGGNVAPEQSLAYAQQYASTGQIPTGLPKGSFGKIAMYAKELPKPDGTLVDMNTGVRPSKLSADEEKGIGATYDIVNKKLPLLIEKFNSNYTGVLGGLGGLAYTSQDRQDFETTRGEVLNLLLQARSGATVSPQEYDRYSKLIPTSFNQPFFLGSDGAKKLQSLQNSLNDTLNSKLSTSGASIYGYSKVKTSDGVERTVGDIIEANGIRGRINHDGTVTQVQ